MLPMRHGRVDQELKYIVGLDEVPVAVVRTNAAEAAGRSAAKGDLQGLLF